MERITKSALKGEEREREVKSYCKRTGTQKAREAWKRKSQAVVKYQNQERLKKTRTTTTLKSIVVVHLN